MQNMMLIFRRNFTEVIEIGTSLQARDTPADPGIFHSHAYVGCFVRRVSNPEHDGLKFLRILKSTSGYQHEYMKLAELLHQIALWLPTQQIEDDDDDDGTPAPVPWWGNQPQAPVPAQMQQPHVAQMQGNHQPYNAAQAPTQMQSDNLPIQQLTNQAAALNIHGQQHGQQWTHFGTLLIVKCIITII